MATANSIRNGTLYYCRWCREHEFYSDGRVQTNSDYAVAKAGNEDYYWGMGLTAEAVAQQFKVSREDQDEFAYNSHLKH
jgi:acetyl-CoA acyltransferase